MEHVYISNHSQRTPSTLKPSRNRLAVSNQGLVVLSFVLEPEACPLRLSTARVCPIGLISISPQQVLAVSDVDGDTLNEVLSICRTIVQVEKKTVDITQKQPLGETSWKGNASGTPNIGGRCDKQQNMDE